jgi:hypothetical protein
LMSLRIFVAVIDFDCGGFSLLWCFLDSVVVARSARENELVILFLMSWR